MTWTVSALERRTVLLRYRSAIRGPAEWYPKDRWEIGRTFELSPSRRALESLSRIAARIRSRRRRIVQASLTSGRSRERLAQEPGAKELGSVASARSQLRLEREGAIERASGALDLAQDREPLHGPALGAASSDQRVR
jgi:hypothetical protein